jgi:hypothetical protein
MINARGKIENTDLFPREIRRFFDQILGQIFDQIADSHLNFVTKLYLDQLAETHYNITRKGSQSDDQLRGEITSIYK